MNPRIGTLSAFDAKEQTWEEYCEILDQFFEANEIDDGEKQRAILISVPVLHPIWFPLGIPVPPRNAM